MRRWIFIVRLENKKLLSNKSIFPRLTLHCGYTYNKLTMTNVFQDFSAAILLYNNISQILYNCKLEILNLKIYVYFFIQIFLQIM